MTRVTKRVPTPAVALMTQAHSALEVRARTTRWAGASDAMLTEAGVSAVPCGRINHRVNCSKSRESKFRNAMKLRCPRSVEEASGRVRSVYGSGGGDVCVSFGVLSALAS